MAIQQTFDFLSLPAQIEPPGGRANTSVDQGESLSVLDQLRAKVGCIYSHSQPATDQVETWSTGSSAIDGLLPGGGLRVGAITEWVASAEGSGAAALSLIAAATRLQSPQTSGPLVVVCRPDQFYPPAAVALGIPADRIIWVRPNRDADTVWAIDQALRSMATAVLWAAIGEPLDNRDARRFQLAAEIGNTPGLLLRSQAVRGRPTFADIRFHVGNEVQASCRAMRVTLDRCRGGQIGRSVAVQINDRAGIDPITLPAAQSPADRHPHETAPLHLATQLSRPQRIHKQRTA